MLRQRVADHYRSKGYRLQEHVRVEGGTGRLHAVELLVQGPMGSLAVSFEDESGFEGPELAAVRRAARDIGATPVAAVERVTPRMRAMAIRAGVVLLDGEDLEGDAVPRGQRLLREAGLEEEPHAWPNAKRDPSDVHPWPASGRSNPLQQMRARAMEVEDMLQSITDELAALPTAAQPAPSAAKLWRKTAGDDRGQKTVRIQAAQNPSPSPAQPDGAPRFGWLQSRQAPASAPRQEPVAEETTVQPRAVSVDAPRPALQPVAPQPVEIRDPFPARAALPRAAAPPASMSEPALTVAPRPSEAATTVQPRRADAPPRRTTPTRRRLLPLPMGDEWVGVVGYAALTALFLFLLVVLLL